MTTAINDNIPENNLFQIFEFILRANMSLGKLALFISQDDEWKQVAGFGAKGELPLDKLTAFETAKVIAKVDKSSCDGFETFDHLIPVLHKERLLALVFIGTPTDINQDEDEMDLDFIQALSNITMVAIENKRLARKQMAQQALQREIEIAREVQQVLVPTELPVTEWLDVDSYYKPHLSLGGDYFDYIKIDEDQFILCIADVSGKGLAAALLMANFQATLRTMVRNTQNLVRIVHELNFQVYQSANSERYITFFIALYNKATKSLKFVNSGHNPPILFKEGGEMTLLKSGSTVLGFFEPLPFLNPGEILDLDKFTLFTFTDGLTETFNMDEQEFGLEKLTEVIASNLDLSSALLNEKVLKTLNEFRGESEISDDITILTSRVNANKS